MAQKLFVGGLSWGTTEDALRDFFSQVGTVVSATIIKDKFTEKSKGFGFVEMETEEMAKKAIDLFNGSDMGGRKIIVSEARAQESSVSGVAPAASPVSAPVEPVVEPVEVKAEKPVKAAKKAVKEETKEEAKAEE